VHCCTFVPLNSINVKMYSTMIDFNALFKVSYGMYIVSSGTIDKGNGFISNSVFQVTAEPAKFAACCNKDNFTAELIAETGAFAISVLKQDSSRDTIGTFGYKSGRTIKKFEHANVKTGELGIPVVLDDTIATIECVLVDTFDVGTHFIFIGEVKYSEILSDEIPLTYAFYREIKKGIAPKNAPTYIDKAKLAKPAAQKSKKYQCVICGHIYDPEKGDPKSGVAPGTAFEDLPPGWTCPVCGASADDFEEIQ
jgi:flavin reductase (DIM6/NTAB) family NADH-FMN oxidoreductase RutF/rubredoxin